MTVNINCQLTDTHECKIILRVTVLVLTGLFLVQILLLQNMH